jgi:transcription antitermination factor NusG
VRGHKVQRARYLFPRYLFVWMSERWHDLFRTEYVSKVLLTGDQPAKLPEGWVDKMRASEHNGLIVLPKHRFRLGQPVLVTGGLFEGARGLYQGMTGQQREIVLLDLLGARVELQPGLLR